MLLHNHIEALERASAPNRALDGDTIDILALAPQGFKRAGGSQPDLWRDSTGTARVPTWLAPKVTACMDDAAMMIPPGWRIRSMADANGQIRCRVILEKIDTKLVRSDLPPSVVGYGCNRAIAILAAAMRAKAYERGSPMSPSHEFAAEQHALETAMHAL